VKSSSGAGEAERVLALKDEASVTQWAHGVLTYFTFPSGKTAEIWEMPMEGGAHTPRLLKRGSFNFTHGRISPDGHWLSFTSGESGREEVYVETYPEHTGKWQVSTGGGSDARWNANGKELVYLSADQRLMSVAVRAGTAFEADLPKPLCPVRVIFPGLPIRAHYDMTNDGQRFLLGAPQAATALAGSSVVLNWVEEAKRR